MAGEELPAAPALITKQKPANAITEAGRDEGRRTLDELRHGLAPPAVEAEPRAFIVLPNADHWAVFSSGGELIRDGFDSMDLAEAHIMETENENQ